MDEHRGLLLQQVPARSTGKCRTARIDMRPATLRLQTTLMLARCHRFVGLLPTTALVPACHVGSSFECDHRVPAGPRADYVASTNRGNHAISHKGLRSIENSLWYVPMRYDSDHLSSKQVASMLNISPVTLCEWRKKKIGPPYTKLVGRVYYIRSEILDWQSGQRFSA